jgi:hypothetical protein
MSDKSKHKSRARIGWTLFTLFVLYPLSIGPADCILGRCSAHSRISDGLHAAYYPISSICGKSATLTTLLGHYLVLWHRAAGDPVE